MTKNKKRILLTGGTGFLGRNLLDSLHKKYEVIVLTRDKVKAEALKEEGFQAVETKFFLEANDAGAIDLLIHASSDTRKSGNLIDSINANVKQPLEIIGKINNGNLKIINIDSTFYESEKNNYSLTKKHFSELLALLNFPVMNFKIDNIYGPDDNPSRFIPRILNELNSNVSTIKLTEGVQERDFVHISDVVSILEIATDHIFTDYNEFKTFGIGSGAPVSVRKAVLLLKEISENTVTKLDFGAIEYKLKDPEDLKTRINISNTKAFFNWSPDIDLTSGLRQLVDRTRKI